MSDATPATPTLRRARDHHPSPSEYVRIALILAVVTALEVAVYYVPAVAPFLVPLLFLFAVVKFALVVMWFMHLRFESRTYSRFLMLGIAGAVTLFVVVLLTFGVFGGGGA